MGSLPHPAMAAGLFAEQADRLRLFTELIERFEAVESSGWSGCAAIFGMMARREHAVATVVERELRRQVSMHTRLANEEYYAAIVQHRFRARRARHQAAATRAELADEPAGFALAD